jgi:ActR/RegA family two-component response regulator
MLSEVLSREGHCVSQALSAREAFELIKHNKFDLAFVDIELSDASGLSVLCHLKHKSPGTVAAVISGKSDINYAIESIKAGAFRYLKKPFEVDSILEITASALKENKRRRKMPQMAAESINHLDWMRLLADLAMLIPSLMAGFIIQQKIYNLQGIPLLWGIKEVILMVMSYVFCYAFIYATSFGYTLRENDGFNVRMLKAYGTSYVLYASILFFAADFGYGKLVLISGFILGAGGIMISRNSILPALEKVIKGRTDGPKKIVFKRIPQEMAAREPMFFDREIVPRPGGRNTGDKPMALKTEIRDRCAGCPVDEKNAAEDWGSRLIKEFNNNRLRRQKR